MKDETIRYESAAVYMTDIKGWVCAKCKKYYGKEEHFARRCCSNDIPCTTEGCQNRCAGGYSVCKKCQEISEKKYREEVISKMTIEEWDGNFPICAEGEEFFSDEYEVEDRIFEILYDLSGKKDKWDKFCETVTEEKIKACVSKIVFHPCYPQDKDVFDIDDFVEWRGSDLLNEDAEIEATNKEKEEIEKIVNSWLEKHIPMQYFGNEKIRISTESIMKMLPVRDKEESNG